MLAQRLRRWPNINTPFVQRLVSAGHGLFDLDGISLVIIHIAICDLAHQSPVIY